MPFVEACIVLVVHHITHGGCWVVQQMLHDGHHELKGSAVQGSHHLEGVMVVVQFTLAHNHNRQYSGMHCIMTGCW